MGACQPHDMATAPFQAVPLPNKGQAIFCMAHLLTACIPLQIMFIMLSIIL